MRMKFSRDRPLAAQYLRQRPYVEAGGVLATAHAEQGYLGTRRAIGSRCKSKLLRVLANTILDVRLQTMA